VTDTGVASLKWLIMIDWFSRTSLTGGAIVSRYTCARELVDPVSACGAVQAGVRAALVDV